MKHGKKPTMEQKKFLKALGLNHANWFVSQDTPEHMIIIHRLTGTVRCISKRMEEDDD